MRTILLADDEVNLRTLVHTTLEDPSYRILEASDGIEALELARSENPDILLLDWAMPGLGGLELVKELRADPLTRKICVIMLTASGQEKDRSRAIEAGCDHYLVKPFSPLELLELVQYALAKAPADGRGPKSEKLPVLVSEMLARLESADPQLALYARDLKRAFDQERLRAKDLAAANARLESTGLLKTEFLSFVCHKLRTPLNSISALSLLDPSTEPQEQSEVLALVREGYDHLHELIEKGLEYFRWLAAGKLTTTETADLALVVEHVADRMIALHAPEIRLVVHSRGIAGQVRGRSVDLEKVVEVLLDNAVKCSPDHKIIEVDLCAREDGVVLSVSDHGVGIPEAMLQEIFEPFTCADFAHPTAGFCLGLAMARAIVEAHGGKIHAESAGPGKGSTFTVDLPATLLVAATTA